METIYSISVGLACITDKKRGGHFPYIDHDKLKLKICIAEVLLYNIKITVSKKIYKIKRNKIGTDSW